MKVLGISAFYHDSAACLVEDGEIVAAAQEERFTRVKHDAGFPGNAVRYCLAEGGIGDGGLVATNDRDLAEKIRSLRMHGEGSRYYHELIGINSRLDAIQARVLQIKLRYLEGWCAQRVMRAQTYHNLFTAAGLLSHGIIQLPGAGTGGSHVFNYYVIRVERRNRLKQYLTDHGIQSEVYYPVPLHLQPCFSYLGYRQGDFPSAESIASEVLALPMYPEITLSQQELVVRTIRDFFHS